MGAPEAIPAAVQLAVTLDDAQRKHLAEAEQIVAHARSLVVDSVDMAQYANGELRTIKERKRRIEAMHDDIVSPIKLALANAKKWFLPSLESHDQAETIIKAKLSDFTRREAERVATEQRARQEAERKAREEADRLAAAARARAEAAAAESRKKAAEAAERERVAREAGNTRAAAAAAAERAKQEEAERQRLADGERKAAEAQLAAANAAHNAAPVRQAEEVKGFSMRDNWVAEIQPGKTEDEAKLLVVQAIAAGRSDLLGLLEFDLAAASKLAKALKKNFSVPGYQAINKPVPVSRG